MTAPHTMAARRSRIRGLLASESISSQDQLRESLAAGGVIVTQATLSRDLEAIGAVKLAGADGAVRYGIPEPTVIARLEQPNGVDAVARIVCDVLVGAEAAENLAVLRTPPGAAMYLAGTIDRAGTEGVIGTVAGDDTVIVVTRSAKDATELCRRLLEVAEGAQSLGSQNRQAPPTGAQRGMTRRTESASYRSARPTGGESTRRRSS